MADGIVRCVTCGKVTAAERLDGELLPEGVTECPDCDGTEFAPVTVEETDLDPLEPPDGEPKTPTD